MPPEVSGDGVEGGHFVVHFDWDTAVEAVPRPLEAVLPFGGMVYQATMSGRVNPADDTDSYTFEPDVGQVICFTRIVGATVPTQIIHAWYYEGETMAKVPLDVDSTDWRTYSSKNILPSWKGRYFSPIRLPGFRMRPEELYRRSLFLRLSTRTLAPAKKRLSDMG